jgi:hypothetical protein
MTQPVRRCFYKRTGMGSNRGRFGHGLDGSTTTLFSHHHHNRRRRRPEDAARLSYLIKLWCFARLKHDAFRICILHFASCILHLAEYCIATDSRCSLVMPPRAAFSAPTSTSSAGRAQMQFHHPTWRREYQVPSSSRHCKARKRHPRVARPRTLILLPRHPSSWGANCLTVSRPSSASCSFMSM